MIGECEMNECREYQSLHRAYQEYLLSTTGPALTFDEFCENQKAAESAL